MERYTTQESVKRVDCQNQCSIRQIFSALRPIYGLQVRPTESTISRVTKFGATRSVIDQTTPVHHQKARSLENIAEITQELHQKSYLVMRLIFG